MRLLFVLAICATLSCGHTRVAIVGGMTVVGAVGVGLPLSQDCAEHSPGDCGFAHDATYIAAGTVFGAVLGLLAQYEYARQTKHAAEKKNPFGQPLPEPMRAPPDDLEVEPRVEDFTAPLAPIATCVRDLRDQVDLLDRGCRLQPTAALEDLCAVSTEVTCAPLDGTVHVLGFAIGENSLATAEATRQAERKCWEAPGDAQPATVRCECGDTCACVADVECRRGEWLPAGGVP